MEDDQREALAEIERVAREKGLTLEDVADALRSIPPLTDTDD